MPFIVCSNGNSKTRDYSLQTCSMKKPSNYIFINCTSCLFKMGCVLSCSKMFSLIYCCPARAANSVVISTIITDTVSSGRFSWLESMGSFIIWGHHTGLSVFEDEFSEDLSACPISVGEPSGRRWWVTGKWRGLQMALGMTTPETSPSSSPWCLWSWTCH